MIARRTNFVLAWTVARRARVLRNVQGRLVYLTPCAYASPLRSILIVDTSMPRSVQGPFAGSYATP